MEEFFVQFSGAEQKEIVATFGCVQDEKVYPNQGSVEVDDPRWLTYFNGLPLAIQESMARPAQPKGD
ncbi:hypothetical protein RAS12_13245 [Achromobacter seleniivolatilans]|uniref:Uncharacterized protein n=1 Tax=Achromobacter seleniivolatilans TaxID=3047478 RepID=A0ABY9M8W9_9BURK|nr:hypothetical protein [Achromobacter sp. R39]WMD23290.1 hypothetical protein RAS12_13245 [Achromobacter sp. R39]